MRWFFTFLLSLVVVSASASVYVHDPGFTTPAPAYVEGSAINALSEDVRAAASEHDNFLTDEAVPLAVDVGARFAAIDERPAAVADTAYSTKTYSVYHGERTDGVREHERCCSSFSAAGAHMSQIRCLGPPVSI